MDQAILLTSDPLAAKLAGMTSDMIAAVAGETGVTPVIAKISIQMPDDSAWEARVETCPDRCGQACVVQAVIPRLSSGHEHRPGQC